MLPAVVPIPSIREVFLWEPVPSGTHFRAKENENLTTWVEGYHIGTKCGTPAQPLDYEFLGLPEAAHCRRTDDISPPLPSQLEVQEENFEMLVHVKHGCEIQEDRKRYGILLCSYRFGFTKGRNDHLPQELHSSRHIGGVFWCC